MAQQWTGLGFTPVVADHQRGIVAAHIPLSTEIRHVRGAAAALALFEPLRRQPREMIAVAYLDPEWRLLGMRHTHSGSADAANLPIRDIVADSLAFDTASALLAHNHPGGDPTPSKADCAVTRRLARALDAVEVRLLDHLILAARGEVSFRELELL